ncbi:MAG TPA: hypothetical protein P5255_12175, partial [Phycisphaerae bacterium]|nr:hypothetical protein [Phycisphaerae bacterium]
SSSTATSRTTNKSGPAPPALAVQPLQAQTRAQNVRADPDPSPAPARRFWPANPPRHMHPEQQVEIDAQDHTP